jgi:hypothetical protein
MPVQERVTWTYAPPDSDEIHITSDTERDYEGQTRLDLFLKRIPQVAAHEDPAASPQGP